MAKSRHYVAMSAKSEEREPQAGPEQPPEPQRA